jgi:hypothetical protein
MEGSMPFQSNERIYCPNCGWDYVQKGEIKEKVCGRCGTTINQKKREAKQDM